MPAKSEGQRRLFGAALGAKRKGKKKPPYVPPSMWKMSTGALGEFTHKVSGKKKKKSKKRR